MYGRRHPSSSHAFWDRIAAKYARKPIADHAAYEAKLTRVRAALGPDDRVLEIGCGTGGTALRLAESVAHVTATDASRAMIEIAAAKLGAGAPPNVRFRQADAAETIDGAPFDVVCAFSLLHLVEDPRRVIARAWDQVRPGGLFISKTVCLGDAARPLRRLVPVLTAVGLAPRVAILSRADLVRGLEEAGFEVDLVKTFDKRRMSPFVIARRPNSALRSAG